MYGTLNDDAFLVYLAKARLSVLILDQLLIYLKSYLGVEDPEFAITQLAQTTMRSEIGKITLDTLFRERDNLNAAIVIAINQASEAWGIQCMR